MSTQPTISSRQVLQELALTAALFTWPQLVLRALVLALVALLGG